MIKKIRKILTGVVIAFLAFFGLTQNESVKDAALSGFRTVRGFSTLSSTTATDVTYDFGTADIPTERAGAASSSTGFEFGKVQLTSATAITTVSTSAGFAVTMQQSGRIKGCAFELNALPTTGTVSVQVQKNGTLQTGKYCKLGNFATNAIVSETSANETFLEDNITFIAGDRIGLIASSSGLNAATVDAVAKLTVQLQN
mgnify:FL=1